MKVSTMKQQAEAMPKSVYNGVCPDCGKVDSTEVIIKLYPGWKSFNEAMAEVQFVLYCHSCHAFYREDSPVFLMYSLQLYDDGSIITYAGNIFEMEEIAEQAKVIEVAISEVDDNHPLDLNELERVLAEMEWVFSGDELAEYCDQSTWESLQVIHKPADIFGDINGKVSAEKVVLS